MASKDFFRQCKLRKKDGDITEHTTSWIPEIFAKVGNICELRIVNEYVDGWKIINVSKERLTGMDVYNLGRKNKDFTHSIKTSKQSLPYG